MRKSQNVQNKHQIEKFAKVVNDLKYVCHMRIIGVEISKMSKCAKQTANRKVLKHCKSYIHCVRHVGNDDLNYVCYSSHDTHYRSRNFEKVKIRKTNGKWRTQCI